MSLLNNFVVEKASFDGSQIGILQSLREISGFLAFSVVLVMILKIGASISFNSPRG